MKLASKYADLLTMSYEMWKTFSSEDDYVWWNGKKELLATFQGRQSPGM
jgi:hypothetical protein